MRIHQVIQWFSHCVSCVVHAIQRYTQALSDKIKEIPSLCRSQYENTRRKWGKLKFDSKRYTKWLLNTIRKKYAIPAESIISALVTIAVWVIIGGSFLYMLTSSQVLIIPESGLPYPNPLYSSDYITKNGVLGSQITFVLICVSLIALVSNIDQKFIYGEKLIHLAFAKSGPLSFRPIMIGLFALLVFNVIQMFQHKCFARIIIVYVITMYMALIILYRFSFVFLNQYAMKKKLLRRYYRNNITHMQKDKPQAHHNSIALSNLKNVTLKHVIENNITALNENMVLYFSLLEHTLYNQPQLVQEYHTELLYDGDIICHISEISLTLLNQGHALYGLRTYVALLNKLNFYKVTTVTDMILSNTASEFIEAMTSFSNKSQLVRYLNCILAMNTELIEQVNVFSSADLSYCRLASHKLIHSFAVGNMYERTYDQLNKITYLSPEDRHELMDMIRMNIISLYTREELRVNIDNFRTWPEKHISKRMYSLDIRSVPVAHYLLRLIESTDAEHLWDFRFMFRDAPNRQSDEVYAKILSILSVLNMLYHGNKRKYAADLSINEAATIDLFKKTEYLKFSISTMQVEKYYSFTIQNYVEGKTATKDNSCIPYQFSRFFSFDKIVVDTFFICMHWRNNPGNSLDTITSQYALQYDKHAHSILEALGFELPQLTD